MNTEITNEKVEKQAVVSGSTLISECDLSIRTKKLFENAGLKVVEDILKENKQCRK